MPRRWGGQDLFQGLKGFRRHPQGLGKGGAADRHDHELLDVQVVAGVGPAVDDIQHGHGQRGGIGTPQVAVEGQARQGRPGPGRGHGDRQNGVGSQAALGGGAVQFAHQPVQGHLLRRVEALELGGDDFVDVLHRLQHPFSQIAAAAVPQLQGLVFPGGGAGGHHGLGAQTVVQPYFGQHRGLAPGIQDSLGANLLNNGHAFLLSRKYE